MRLAILSGGAALGLVAALRAAFLERTGYEIEGEFGAVGAMKELLLQCRRCDVVILTSALIDDLTGNGHLLPESSAAVGLVRTGIAVRTGMPLPGISDSPSLADALRTADAIYCPDLERSTAGIHFRNVLRKLGIDTEVAPRLRPYPNGAIAMSNLAKSVERNAIGCTQITEISYAHGVTLVGPLPREFELTTEYRAAVCTRAENPEVAKTLVAMLSAADLKSLRLQCGFE